MASTRYRVNFRRRREGRTDYRLRRKLITSRQLRLVIRKTVKHVNIQMIEAKIEGDKVLAHAGTMDLQKYGWKAGTGNLPAAYLTGFLLGKRALCAGLNAGIVDLNRYKITTENRLLAAMKGAIDAGLELPHDKKVLPKSKRVVGSHIAEYAAKLQSEDPGKYQSYFSVYLANGIAPEKLVEHVEAVKATITKEVK